MGQDSESLHYFFTQPEPQKNGNETAQVASTYWKSGCYERVEDLQAPLLRRFAGRLCSDPSSPEDTEGPDRPAHDPSDEASSMSSTAHVLAEKTRIEDENRFGDRNLSRLGDLRLPQTLERWDLEMFCLVRVGCAGGFA